MRLERTFAIVAASVIQNFIKEIRIRTSAGLGDQSLWPLFPTTLDKPNKLTVLCGRNRSGKTHILRYVDRSLAEHNAAVVHHKPVGEEFTPDTINVRCRLVEPQTFLADDFSQRFNDFDNTRWSVDPKYRNDLVMRLDEKRLYRCRVGSKLVSCFEDTTGAVLYLKREPKKRGVEPFLVYTDRIRSSIDSWSHGQRILFAYMCLVYYLKPSILLIDEPETHLHPEYISVLCEAVKEHVPQCVLATHHPHIIFSRYADDVYYLEIPRNMRGRHKDEIEFSALTRPGKKPPVESRVERAANVAEKLQHAYKLFSTFDNTLRDLADTQLRLLDVALQHALEIMFSRHVLAASESIRPDLQSDKLGMFLAELLSAADGKALSVIDIGAGLGRSLFEVLKRTDLPLDRVRWDMWEPNTKTRSELKERLNTANIKSARVLEESELKEGNYDLAVIVNVLHELNPPAIAQLLDACRIALAQTGVLLILELYPLLNVEKWAVPYDRNDLNDVLRKCGWITALESLNIRSGTSTAYWIKARFGNGDTGSRSNTQAQFEEKWHELQWRVCSDYRGIEGVNSPEAVVNVLGSLATSASIASYFVGVWK